MFLRVRGAGERRVTGIPVRENHFVLYEAMSFTELENYFGFQRPCIGQYLIPGIEMSINRINCRHKKNLDCKKVTRYNCAQLASSLLNEHVLNYVQYKRSLSIPPNLLSKESRPITFFYVLLRLVLNTHVKKEFSCRDNGVSFVPFFNYFVLANYLCLQTCYL